MIIIKHNHIQLNKTIVLFYYSTKYNEKEFKRLEKKFNNIQFIDIHDLKNRPEFRTFYLNFNTSYSCHVYENGIYIRKLDVKHIEVYLNDLYHHKLIEKIYSFICCHHRKSSKEHYKIYFRQLPIVSKKKHNNSISSSSSESGSSFSFL